MISVDQYNFALSKLSENQLRVLKILSEIEPVKDSVIIAEKLGYKNWGGANLQIGKIGKDICSSLKITPDLSDYNPDISQGGFFIVIHRQYHNNGTYWDMEPNLRKALEKKVFSAKKTNQYFIQYHNADKLKYLPDTKLADVNLVSFETNIRDDFSFFTHKKISRKGDRRILFYYSRSW